jgi:AraC-like DNA-binding protein
MRWRYDTREALIMLRASLCCDVSFEVGSSMPLVFNRPEVTLVCLPQGRPQAVDIAGGARQQGMVAIFRAADFPARYGLQLSDLPPLVRDAVTGSAQLGRIASFPLDHRLAGLLADTIETRLDGELRVVQYAGRLAELVAFTLDAMQHTPQLRGGALNRLRDVELAHAALQRLERDFRKPPLFADLAREIGTNQNKLKAVFKEAFGVTMADYCLERRMREAQQLLLEATLTIAQVAERVGYEHQSSFAAAFGGHVGMSPRQYRQHRAPFNLSLGTGEPGPAARP